MATANSIIKKVTAALNKVGPPDRAVYLRQTARTNQNALTGYAGTVTYTDTLLSPQPYYARLGRDRISGGHTRSEDALMGSGTVGVLDDWVFYLSPDSLSLGDISSPDFLIVLKSTGAPSKFGAAPFDVGTEASPDSREEVLKLIDTDNAMIYGSDVLFTCYMRSMSRS